MSIRAVKIGFSVVILSLGFVMLAAPQGKAKKMNSVSSPVARGKYLVMVAGCNDCHTPKVMTPQGPSPDPTRTLSGHPAGEKLPDVPSGVLAPEKWGALTNNNLTAWAGPWGVSFTKNLTPDKATGLGSWTEAMFIKALRTGKDMGEGRQILPPMPWQDFGQMTDADLKAIYAYLQSLPPVSNAVPDPVPPQGDATAPGK